MAVGERDPHTGYMTTGHEWNGIKELNTPVPRAVYFFLIVTALFAVVYWVLMPAWPLGLTYTKGLLGIDQRTTVAGIAQTGGTRPRDLDAADRSGELSGHSSRSQPDDDRAPDRPHIVRRQLCGVSRLQCERRQGLSEPHNGILAVGRRSGDHRRNHSRRHQFNPSEDPRGADARLRARPDVVAAPTWTTSSSYVRTLSDPAASRQIPPAKLEAGKAAFAANCASCHGDDGKGKIELGAPNLTDKSWIYGGDAQSIFDERVERSARPHADMGKPPRCRRAQDSRALPRRSEVASTHEPDADHGRAETEARDLAAGLHWPAGPRRGQRPSRLRRDDVPAGLRRTCPAGRRQGSARAVQRGEILMHARIRDAIAEAERDRR